MIIQDSALRIRSTVSSAIRSARSRDTISSLVRYADDWCLMVSGTRADAEALREEIAEVLSTMGLRLSPEQALITHIDEGLDSLGWRIQRHRKRGTRQYHVYMYPSRKAVPAVKRKAEDDPAEGRTEPTAR